MEAVTQQILAALELPAGCWLDQRVPKQLLSERGAVTRTDRRLIDAQIEALHWLAVLKPQTIGVTACRETGREVLEVAVLQLEARAGHGFPRIQAARLEALVHRAVPYPVLLLLHSADVVSLSLAHKRAAQKPAGAWVLEGDMVRLSLSAEPDANLAWLPALALAQQPHGDLRALVQGWMDVLIAAQIAQHTGIFRLARDAADAEIRRTAFAAIQRLDREIHRSQRSAARERQMHRKVELNLSLQRLQAERAALQQQV